MKKNNELKIKVPEGWSFTVEEKPDGSRVFKFAPATAEDTTCHHQKDIFKLVRASELSRIYKELLKDYSPKTPAEKAFMEAVKKVIEAGVQDFYRPTLDPSFDGDGRIYYQAGMMPATGKSYNWWAKEAEKYCPERKSRLGTKSQYIAFLAVFIDELVASGKSLEWAVNAVCNDSKELGHYHNSSDAKLDFEATGNREVCGWRDLANTYKILEEDKDAGGFWSAGGFYFDFGDNNPLAFLCHYGNRSNGFSYYNRSADLHLCTGWIVLS